jgi:imidazolonepropionase-like amidohydrolase
MRTLFANALVFDGTGTDPVPNDILVDNGTIVELGDRLVHRLASEPDVEIVDLAGLTIIPGLIDAHVHAIFNDFDSVKALQQPFSYQFYAAQKHLERLLDIGITTVRDAGGADLGMKQAAADGLIDGPDLVISISILGQTGGHSDGWNVHGTVNPLFISHPGRPELLVDGPIEMRKRVRELVRAGADVIKICTTGGISSLRDHPEHTQFSLEEIQVCVEEAASAGIGVMAHAQGKQGVLNALRGGVRSIEHGIYADDECFDLMKQTGAWLVPTLAAPFEFIRTLDEGAQVAEVVSQKARAVLEVHARMMRGAVAAGVKIAMGTDSGVFPHGRNLAELVHMKKAGMTSADVLAASTSSSAELLGLADRGVLEAGRRADLVALEGDAYDFADYADRIRMVVKKGVVVRGA